MRRTFALLLVAVLASLSQAQPVTPKMRGFDTESIGIDQKLGTMVPLDTRWTNTDGKEIRLGEIFELGHPVIFVPVFFRCRGVCLVVLDSSVKAVNALRAKYPEEEFEVVSFSINPEETTIDAKIRLDQISKVYTEVEKERDLKTKVDDAALKQWHLLTGNMDSITRLTTALGFRFTYEPEIDRINHAAGIIVATPNGVVSGYLYGRDYSARILKESLDTARTEKLSAPAQSILLGCFMMDPNTGKYRMVVGRTLQVAGTGTVLILATSILLMSRRHRQRSRRELNSGGVVSDSEQQ